MSNYRMIIIRLVNTLPEKTLQLSVPHTDDDDGHSLHTCACGEQHRHSPGSGSHRDECTSSKKFGDTCCCGSNNDSNQQPCGHGPRCHK